MGVDGEFGKVLGISNMASNIVCAMCECVCTCCVLLVSARALHFQVHALNEFTHLLYHVCILSMCHALTAMLCMV